MEGAIALCDGNITRAADLLGVNASTIYRKRAAWSGGA
ncbi:MAG: helix-turn-helix domain-containing protein [Kiloniellaceae bacterium]